MTVDLGMPELPPREEREPIVVSNSSIQTWKDCRRKFWLSYMRRLKPKQEKKSGALALGSRVHLALETYYGELLDAPGLTDRDRLMEIWAKLVEDDKFELEAEGRYTDDFDNEAELGRIMLEGYYDWVEEEGIDSRYEIIGLEDTLEYPIHGGQVRVVGKLDQRVRDTVDGTILVRDFKPLRTDQRVATPEGWKTIGELQSGDVVLGAKHEPVTVTGVFDRPAEDLYKVTFNDNSSVVCTADHPWYARRHKGQKPRVVETKDLVFTAGRSPHRIQPIAPVDSADVDLPVDPYVMGTWLGDGGRYTGRGRGTKWQNVSDADRVWRVGIEVGERPVADEVASRVGEQVAVKAPRKQGYKELYKVSAPIGIALEAYGIHDKYSYEKWIPMEYLRSSKAQRLQLLRGLMDTDGQVNTHSNSVALRTTSEQLAMDFADLVRSLGGWAKPTKLRESRYRVDGGEYVHTGTFLWHVTIRLDDAPFGYNEARLQAWERSSAGRASYASERWSKDKIVASVEPVDAAPSRCISLDSEDHLFITEGMTLTHNTSANFSDLMKTLEMNEQFLLYMTLEQLLKDENDRVSGAIVTALKKVKRTANARPPFYANERVDHNVFTLRNFYKHLLGVSKDILEAWRDVEDGADPHVVMYPHPTRDCSWKCPFAAGCSMFDNGGAAEQWLADNFEVGSPFAYYGDSDPTKKKTS